MNSERRGKGVEGGGINERVHDGWLEQASEKAPPSWTMRRMSKAIRSLVCVFLLFRFKFCSTHLTCRLASIGRVTHRPFHASLPTSHPLVQSIRSATGCAYKRERVHSRRFVHLPHPSFSLLLLCPGTVIAGWSANETTRRWAHWAQGEKCREKGKGHP